MNFSETPPSHQWAALTYRGERFAEVWFKPAGEPYGLTYRIPQSSFQLPGIAQLLTTENLLKAVGIAIGEIESWRHGDSGHSGTGWADPALRQPLPAPEGVAALTLTIRVKPPQPMVSSEASDESALGQEQLQDLEARWNAILSLETSIDALRLRVESAQGEMEAASQRMLTTDEKLNALNADVHQWTKAKGRARFAVPKAKEFIHRATWVIAGPERKQLGELFKDGLRPDVPAPTLDRLPDELARMLKSHQILSAQGGTVYQECKSITAEIQAALRTLLNNSAANAKKSRVATHKKGKYV